MKAKLKLPRVIRGASLAGAAFFGVVFAVTAYVDVYYSATGYNLGMSEGRGLSGLAYLPIQIFSVVTVRPATSLYSRLDGLLSVRPGLAALESICLFVVCLTVFWMNRGFAEAFRRAVTIGAALVTLFELGLLLAAPIWMPVFATGLTLWTVGSVNVLSNWFLLIFSSGLFAFGLVYRRPKL